jgi:uncharacterized iron-regulated membrane protein
MHKGIGAQLTALVAALAVVLIGVVGGLSWQSRRALSRSADLSAAANARVEAQMALVGSPNHSVIYIPVGPMGVPVVSTLPPPGEKR